MLAGVVPIAPTRFRRTATSTDSQKSVLDYMIDHCVDGICILANYSEQFLPSDDERNTLLDLCIGHVRGRVPLVVACSHQVPIAPGGQLQMPLKC